MNRQVAPKPQLRHVVFVVVQTVLLGGLLLLGGFRALALQTRVQLPSLRETPLVVMPTYNFETVITDEQLRDVLTKLVPRDEKQDTKINHVDHALRFWGLEAQFSQSGVFSGQEMRELLVDNAEFAELYDGGPAPLLIDEPHGVGVRVQEGPHSSSHVDHTMASLAEVGTPMDYPVRTATHSTTFQALVSNSLREFSVNQVEYEWSVLTYALLLQPPRSWVSSEGQQIDFDMLARRIMREEMPLGVCFGNHRLYTLVIMLRVDDRESLLSPSVRSEILDYLRRMTKLLVAHQHPDGFWNVDWPRQQPESATPSTREGDRLSDRILATGHALEWWAMAPQQVHPPRETLVRAGQWLSRTILELDDGQVQELYTYLTHAGRALALWRSQPPARVVEVVQDSSH